MEANTDTSDVTLTKWYCQVENGIQGPFQVAQLKEQMENDTIDGMTFCWREGMQDWKRISDLPCLKKELLTECNETSNTTNLDSSLFGKISQEPVTRQPYDKVPSHLKYKDDSGVEYIYDIVTGKFVDFNTYTQFFSNANHVASINNESVSTDTTDLNLKKKIQNIQNRQKYRERLKKRKEKGLWVKPKTNPNVYVKGLTPDLTENDLVQIFRRAGVIKLDPYTCLPKIKLYRNEKGDLTGDALISFVHPDSVTLATKYINGTELPNGAILKVEQAQFKVSNDKLEKETVTDLPETKRKRYIAAKFEEQRQLGWDDGSTNGRIRIMIVRPLWSFNEAKRYPLNHCFYKNICSQLKEAFSEWISVVSVTPIERHPLGIVCVKFRNVEDCEAAVVRLNQQPYRHLGLPDREVELTQQQFEEKKDQVSYTNSCNMTPKKPLLESLNKEELDLLKRVDIFMEAIKLCKSLNDTRFSNNEAIQNEDKKLQDSCFSLQDIDAIEPCLMQQLSHQDFNLLPTLEHSSTNSNNNEKQETYDSHIVQRLYLRERLADFISNHRLQIEAYVYDGKTDLKDQALPSNSDTLLPCSEKSISSKKNSTYQESKVSWEDWLEGDDSDSDDFVIRTE